MKCAVIGIGNIGRHHARNYFEIKKAQLVAVSDKNFEIGKKVARTYNCHFYGDYRRMIEKENFDVVSVATPTSTHYQIAMDCIRAKKHILIEKPIASSLDEAKRLIREAKKNKVKMTIGHIERYNPGLKELKLMIDEGRLGEVKSLIFQRVGLIPTQIKDASVVVDIGIHDIDLANFLLNSIPKKVVAFGGKALISHQVDYADVLLVYESAVVHLQTNWITPLKIRRLMIAGTGGYAEFDFINQSLDFYRHHYAQEFNGFGDFVIKFGRKSKRKIIHVEKREPLKEELESFLRAVRLNRQPEVTGEDGFLALKIALEVSKIIKRSIK